MWLLLIPPVALLLGLLWVSFRSRPRRIPAPQDSIEGYHRQMAALAPPISERDDGQRVRG